MTDAEIRLRCLELALNQAKVEGQAQNLNRVDELQTRFYTGIVNGPSPKPEPAKGKGRKAKVDKSPDLFG